MEGEEKVDGRLYNGGIVVPFTLEERKKIKELMDLGFNATDISKVLGRNKYSVKNEIYRGGRKENYNPEERQKFVDSRYERISSKLKLRPPRFYERVSTEVESLKMQIEIILDLIKENLGRDK